MEEGLGQNNLVDNFVGMRKYIDTGPFFSSKKIKKGCNV